MPFIPVPHTVKTVFTFLDSTEGLSSVGLYFEKENFTESDMGNLLDTLAAGFATDLMAALDTSLVMEYITAYDLNSQEGLKVVKDTNIAGSAAGSQLTGALCAVISFNANRRGKWNAGRNYVPGLNENTVTIDRVNAGTLEVIRLAYQTIIDTPPAGWRWVVVSRYLNGVARVEGITADVATVRSRDQRLGFQRRRVDRQ